MFVPIVPSAELAIDRPSMSAWESQFVTSDVTNTMLMASTMQSTMIMSNKLCHRQLPGNFIVLGIEQVPPQLLVELGSGRALTWLQQLQHF